MDDMGEIRTLFSAEVRLFDSIVAATVSESSFLFYCFESVAADFPLFLSALCYEKCYPSSCSVGSCLKQYHIILTNNVDKCVS